MRKWEDERPIARWLVWLLCARNNELQESFSEPKRLRPSKGGDVTATAIHSSIGSG